MSITQYLVAEPGFFIVASVLVGLVVGSFLNVVILRLPRMMEREWRTQCRELLAAEERPDPPDRLDVPPLEETDSRFDLMVPGSRCPHCDHPVRVIDNIPLLSYLLLRGKCRDCGGRISGRYPLVEVLSGLAAGVVAWHFGFGAPAIAGLLLSWALVALTFIDLDHHLLPDSITLPFMWLGILLSFFTVFVDLASAVIGAIAGYMVLWTIYQLFRLVTGKEGMGYGDFKLLAMLGAWFGWQALPGIVLLSSLVGAAVGITLILVRGQDRNIPIPFGPYLAAAGWLTLLWGQDLLRAYLHWTGMSA